MSRRSIREHFRSREPARTLEIEKILQEIPSRGVVHRVVGVLQALNRPGGFHDDELHVFEAVAAICALAQAAGATRGST